MTDSANNVARVDSGRVDTKRQRVAGRVLRGVLCLSTPLLLLSGCSNDSVTGELSLNQPGGLILSSPEFLTSKAIDESRVEAQVSIDVDGVDYPVTQLSSSSTDLQWIGEVFVPEGRDATLTVNWVESGVEGLPAELGGELLLASYEKLIEDINENRSIAINSDDYVIDSTEGNLRPDLDIDEDGAGNLLERLEDTDPGDADDRPAEVIIYRTNTAPVIDGRYDSIWDNANFFDEEFDEALGRTGELLIDDVLVDKSVIQPGESDRRYRWAAMHDGRYLYLMVFSELAGAQTPFGDSVLAYDDDAIDIFLDGDNSKGNFYDNVDDYHALITLLSDGGTGSANSTTIANTRFALGNNSTFIDLSAFEFAVCICAAPGEQQIYEVRLDLEKAGIPIDKRFGLDIQLNNDVNGGDRDAKWAWHNNSGEDDTWKFPLRMGTARLDPNVDQR